MLTLPKLTWEEQLANKLINHSLHPAPGPLGIPPKTPDGPGMFLCLHFTRDAQTQRHMGRPPSPAPPAFAQQVVRNELIVNLS